MKRKRTPENSLNSSEQQQQLSPATESLHLPDECWESVCRFLVDGDDDHNNHHYLEPLSLTSKQFLSITNRLRSSFTISDITLNSKYLLYITNRLRSSFNISDPTLLSKCTLTITNRLRSSFNISDPTLLSKHFLAIDRRLRSSFTMSDLTLRLILLLFHRFPNLTSLHITRFRGDLNALLCQISKFPFKLKSLKLSDCSTFPAEGLRALSKKITTLTSLTCSNISDLTDNHCILISDCFPLLEELHLQHSHIKSSRIGGSRIGVEAMLTALPKLSKINLSDFGFYYINDNSLLLHLCKNCEFLEEVVMYSCKLTKDGIASAIRQRPTLRSLSFRWSCYYNDIVSSHFIDSLVSLKGLTCLDLSCQNISDELLSSIAMGDLPLRRLVLQYCIGYSYAGVFSLLSKCQHIQHLNLQGAKFLYDNHIVKLSIFLADLVSIDLSRCRRLTFSTWFALVRKCPSLTNIRMEQTRIGKIFKKYNSLINNVLNPELKYLYLAYSSLLKDESLIMVVSIFSNLHLLDLSNCNYISEEGICHVLRRCCKIRHLNLTKCNVVKLSILNFKVPKLEVLNLSYTNVDDEALYAISENCCGLLQLLLEACKVTNKGVKHVIENCTQLREINLNYCFKVCADIDNMVHSRPSLRKILIFQ